MSIINDTNTSLMSSISTNNFLRDCIDLAIDGFLFRGITPSDHYYRFSQSFPKAFSLLPSYSNPNGSTIITTPKQSHIYHASASSSSKHSSIQHQRTNNVPPLDLSSLGSNILLEQQPVSTIMPTANTGITIKPKKPIYSPKDSVSSSSTSDRRLGSSRRPGSSGTKTPLVTSNTPNTPLSSNDQSPSTQSVNPKRPVTAPSPSSDIWNSPQQQLSSLEIEARDIQERMGKYRLRHGRPHDLSQMTPKQIYDEKCDMQQELLRFENKYSKPTTSEQKRIMKPLYDYYRQLKRLVEKQQQT
ncbi:unnamed protein product [Rotaria socialis]|uniref:Uncharacterized protein n=3 Tax=Rotaria socialis TaxID=392032 RepID=A0A818C470_9BILA|nr:unnamed protein product [Rotaria socialis]CAF3310294.1 unnamed protein product [Rotaria socialis]CAF3340441.1 unnamed protein product [Rotaria socialis]CAF3422855.1 unnamed protein product [Rotaria socialis]CAF3537997.1 unnamed protein product [Rotaria socialis]